MISNIASRQGAGASPWPRLFLDPSVLRHGPTFAAHDRSDMERIARALHSLDFFLLVKKKETIRTGIAALALHVSFTRTHIDLFIYYVTFVYLCTRIAYEKFARDIPIFRRSSRVV